MQIRHLSVRKTARVLVLGDPQTARVIWIALHGYAQQIGRFAEALRPLEDDETAVIVPEGLHRFYTKGFSGEVGASWMTREERENDIADYCRYLDDVATNMIPPEATLKLLGFSQGAATATRWACRTQRSIAQLVLWAGVLPHDLDLSNDLPVLQTLDILFVLGDRDEFISEDKASLMETELLRLGIPYHRLGFEGKHHLNSAILNQLRTNQH